MKIYILDGGPRKDGNTAAMCESFARGAAEAGAESERVRLFDYSYWPAAAAASPARRGAAHPTGAAAGATVFTNCSDSVATRLDGVVFASPVYFGTITPQLHAFIERLVFPLRRLRQKIQRHRAQEAGDRRHLHDERQRAGTDQGLISERRITGRWDFLNVM